MACCKGALAGRKPIMPARRRVTRLNDSFFDDILPPPSPSRFQHLFCASNRIELHARQYRHYTRSSFFRRFISNASIFFSFHPGFIEAGRRSTYTIREKTSSRFFLAILSFSSIYYAWLFTTHTAYSPYTRFIFICCQSFHRIGNILLSLMELRTPRTATQLGAYLGMNISLPSSPEISPMIFAYIWLDSLYYIA